MGEDTRVDELGESRWWLRCGAIELGLAAEPEWAAEPGREPEPERAAGCRPLDADVTVSAGLTGLSQWSRCVVEELAIAGTGREAVLQSRG